MKKSDRREIEQIVAEILLEEGSPTMLKRIKNYAKVEKQSMKEIARRTASNMLTSFSDRR